MKKSIFLKCAVCTIVFASFFLVGSSQALTNVANRINDDVGSAKPIVLTLCKALAGIFIIIGIVGAAWKSTTDHNDGAKSWGKWLMASALIGIAFAVVAFFIS